MEKIDGAQEGDTPTVQGHRLEQSALHPLQRKNRYVAAYDDDAIA